MSVDKILKRAAGFLFKNFVGNGEYLTANDGTIFVLHKVTYDQGSARLKVTTQKELVKGEVYFYKGDPLTVANKSSYNIGGWYTSELTHNIQHVDRGKI